MRLSLILVLVLGCLASLLGCGSSGGDVLTVLGGGTCPNDELWNHHLVGPLSTPMPNTQYTYSNSDVAMAADGRFAVVWASDSSIDTGVFMQHYDADGLADGGLIRVSAPAHTSPSAPSIAMNALGRTVVAYQDPSGIYYALYDEMGAEIQAATLLPGSASGSAILPDVAIARNGNGAIASMFVGTPNIVLLQFFDALGTISGPAHPQSFPDNMMDPPDSTVGHAAVAMAEDGSHVVAWTSTGPSAGVRFRSSAAAGAGILTASPASHAGAMSPSASMAPDGRFVLGWVGLGAQGFVQAYDATANPAGALTTANQTGVLVAGTPTSAQRFLDVAMNADGNFAAVWGRDGTPSGVLVRRFDPTGAALADEVVVSTDTVSSTYVPAVAASTCFDNHVVTWVDQVSTHVSSRLYFADDDDDGQADNCCLPGAVTQSFAVTSDRAFTRTVLGGSFTALGPEDSTDSDCGLENDAGTGYSEVAIGFEFDVSAIPAGATIHAVTVTLTEGSTNIGPPILELHAYAGNGAVDLTYAAAINLAAGPFVFEGAGVGMNQTEDVTVKVAALIAGGADFVGLVLRHQDVPMPPPGFVSLANLLLSPNVDAAAHPVLTITYTAP